MTYEIKLKVKWPLTCCVI